MAQWWQPPVRWTDRLATVVIYALACATAAFAAKTVPVYEIATRESGDTRYLPLAYAVAWFGIATSLMLVALWIARAIRWKLRAWTLALVAFPLIAGSWILGFLIAVISA
ncbi:hypothetical protein FOH10_32420 [Nocardia otitidiscaviarum]|uniref:Uncharacterized protein n=1 Tax=Nocardia otitidiscaviarum TaxID=1823 RepID=A0A516NUY8_9NOCA|nr:hypothetical protein [Nocardia otitidiscaviarum]MCP9622159.1 hypothetical protein [Nocardia otitidiscaviarum]QDP82732.1 hypothetical protein FOH10_32420 [Nocardia otitidiscaviarum]